MKLINQGVVADGRRAKPTMTTPHHYRAGIGTLVFVHPREHNRFDRWCPGVNISPTLPSSPQPEARVGFFFFFTRTGEFLPQISRVS